MLSFIKKSKKRLMVKIKRKWVLARRKVSVSGEGRQEPDEEKEKERERGTRIERTGRERERGSEKEVGRARLPFPVFVSTYPAAYCYRSPLCRDL